MSKYSIPEKPGSSANRSPEVLYQYDVISERAAGIDKLFSVAGPGEVEHTVASVRIEVRKQFQWPAVDRTAHNIRVASTIIEIGKSVAVRLPGQTRSKYY